MSKRTIPAAMRRSLVAEARGRCAYCRTPTAISGARLVVDHIVPEALGGATELENLCAWHACHGCNEFKGVQVSWQDPVSRRLVALLHPRRHRWGDHFRWSPDGREILGISRIGRATILALKMNHPLIVEARRLWTAVSWHPPKDEL